MPDCTQKGVLERAHEDYEAAMAADAVDDGIVDIEGRQYMRNARGGLDPVETIKETDKLQDQFVRRLLNKALTVSGQVQAFRNHALDEVDTFVELLLERYGASRGGAKGNVAFMTHDQMFKVERSIGEFIDFGPELEAVKALVEECSADWTDNARSEAKVIVNRAFQTEKGRLRRSELLGLLRYGFEDERWQRAMQALQDSIKVVGTKPYLRFYRKDERGKWTPVSIDLAAGNVAAVGVAA